MLVLASLSLQQKEKKGTKLLKKETTIIFLTSLTQTLNNK